MMLQKTSYSPVVVSSGEEWQDVELTPEEIQFALDGAKILKYERLKLEINDRKRQQMKAEILRPWSPEEMYGYILDHRAGKVGFSKNGGNDGKEVFVVDADNEAIIKALCFYFTNDKRFEELGVWDEQRTGYTKFNWRLHKGILLCGSYGTGKTKLMKMFCKNKRQCFDVMSTSQIASAFSKNGDTIIDFFSNVHRWDVKGAGNFYQDSVGVCFDDLGNKTEGDKIFFGTRANVMQSILKMRYDNGLPFHLTHISTNCTAKALQEHYGGAVWSRILEMFNVVELNGKDRRK